MVHRSLPEAEALISEVAVRVIDSEPALQYPENLVLGWYSEVQALEIGTAVVTYHLNFREVPYPLLVHHETAVLKGS